MKTLILLLSFIPLIGFSQNELIVKGKMNYGEIKNATVQIIEIDNPMDTIIVNIEKKKFELDPLDITKSYELIFRCGDKTKTLKIEKQDEKEEKQSYFYLEIDFDY